MSGVRLTGAQEEELYVLLKAREELLSGHLRELLRAIEGSLFQRLTVEEMERLLQRSAER